MIWAWADKTVITLTALNDLILDSFEVRKVLVIAPLRVARDTWPAEVTKWDHLKGLTYSVAVGTEKERIEALMKRTHIHIISHVTNTVTRFPERCLASISYKTIILVSF